MTRPISVSVWGTEGEAVVNEGRVDHGGLLGKVEQIGQIAEVSVTTAHSVASTILVQHEHLTRTEPALYDQTRLDIHDILHPPISHRSDWSVRP